MRLLYITEDRYPPFRADVVELFAKQIASRGHTITWLMQRGPDSLSATSPTDWHGSRVHLTPRIPGSSLLSRVLNNLVGGVGDALVLPLAFMQRYDVIQVRDKFLTGVYAWAAARMTGAKFVHWMSYPFPESKLYEARNRLVAYPLLVWLKAAFNYLLLYGFILRVADHVFVQSERMKDDVAAKGIPRGKMTAVPMGIRSDQIGHRSDSKPLNTETPLLLHLGLIQKIRHSEILVTVLALVRRHFPGAKLIYVGDGLLNDDRQAVLDLAAKLQLSNAVTITGFMSMEEAWGKVKCADICFSPFFPTPVLLSTSPTKLIEYLAMAKCVVANEHPEQCRVLLDSQTGCCVPWSAESFADEVCRLLSNPVAAQEMAANGPDWVRTHRAYDVVADRVEAIYRSILNTK